VQTDNRKIEKKYRKILIYKQPRSCVDKCGQIIVAARNYTCQLAYACTTDYYKREIYVLYAFGPTHATKIETEMILATFNNIYITGFK